MTGFSAWIRQCNRLHNLVAYFICLPRSRWLDFERFCGYDKNVGGCPSNSLCRTAQLNIMGSLLMTNCTCPTNNEQQVRCNDARQRLQQHNICKGKSGPVALYKFHVTQAICTYFSCLNAVGVRKAI